MLRQSVALPPLAATSLVTGGARSGKSALAERLAHEARLPVTYIATTDARWAEHEDPEMRARIAHHRARRPSGWSTVEEPLALCAAIDVQRAVDRVILVDCLTLWLGNLLMAERDVVEAGAMLCEVLHRGDGPVVLVSNEVGAGIVPANALARRFADEAGRLNQAVAAAVEDVILVTAGLPLWLKRRGEPRGVPACTS